MPAPPAATAQAAGADASPRSKAIVEQRCACATTRQLPNKNVRLDSAAEIRTHAQAVYQQAVVLKLMPMNNATQMTDAERAPIGRWYEAGAPAR